MLKFLPIIHLHLEMMSKFCSVV